MKTTFKIVAVAAILNVYFIGCLLVIDDSAQGTSFCAAQRSGNAPKHRRCLSRRRHAPAVCRQEPPASGSRPAQSVGSL